MASNNPQHIETQPLESQATENQEVCDGESSLLSLGLILIFTLFFLIHPKNYRSKEEEKID
jgi:hypothetical protein